MFYRVKDVQPLSNYNLAVRFENGRCKRYDVRPLFSPLGTISSACFRSRII